MEPTRTVKNPGKKRKFRGQVLPDVKTNLPPRIKAKTEDERQQRRVERILRNRRSAKLTRERKKKEFDELVEKNKKLELELNHAQMQMVLLLHESNAFRYDSGAVTKKYTILDTIQPSLLILSPQSDTDEGSDYHLPPLGNHVTIIENDGISNSASTLEIAIIRDDPILAPADTTFYYSSETQYPAVMVCDLQCPLVELPRLSSPIYGTFDAVGLLPGPSIFDGFLNDYDTLLLPHK